MSARIDRYKAAVYLAQLILENDGADDVFRVEQALADIRDEVAAGRRNQQQFPRHLTRAYELIRDGGHSVRAPLLRVVTESDFDELIKEPA